MPPRVSPEHEAAAAAGFELRARINRDVKPVDRTLDFNITDLIMKTSIFMIRLQAKLQNPLT
jgi:hypothetical protein